MGTATCHLICPPPFTPPCLHAGCSSYQAEATRTLPLSKGLSASSGNSPSATYLHGKPQPKLPQHTQNNMGWLAFCLPFYSISTWRMLACLRPTETSTLGPAQPQYLEDKSSRLLSRDKPNLAGNVSYATAPSVLAACR